MEKFRSPESNEERVERLILDLARKEGMQAEDIVSDIIGYAPYDGNESVNLEYLAEVAEMLGISIEDMNAYAIAKAGY